jgi:hypothetical protein
VHHQEKCGTPSTCYIPLSGDYASFCNALDGLDLIAKAERQSASCAIVSGHVPTDL